VDGGLDDRTQRALEGWLRLHPDVAAELQGHRRLSRLWDRTIPEPPAPEKWGRLQRNIELELRRAPRPPKSGRRWWIVPLALGTVAASAALAFQLLHFDWQSAFRGDRSSASLTVNQDDEDRLRQAVNHPDEQDLPSTIEVLAPDDVDILSMDLRDRSAIVVGALPLKQPLALLTPEEVSVEHLEPGSTQRKPEFTAEPTPMLWVPVRTPER
jgi:hypothetical protein